MSISSGSSGGLRHKAARARLVRGGEWKRTPGSQSLERGLDILEMIEAEGGSVGVREIARRLELSPTIVQRLINSLAARGYIEKIAETTRYRLGYRSLALAANGEHGFDYVVAARRELEARGRRPSPAYPLPPIPTRAHRCRPRWPKQPARA